jgi:hypothetical protein
VLSPARGADETLHPKRCDITQIVLKDCPNRVQANFDDGQHQWAISVAGPIALFEKLERYKRTPSEIYILDYDQFQQGQTRLLKASNAWFLFDAKGDPVVCQEPCIYAFKSRAAADAARKDIGGQLLDWDEVSAKADELAEEWEPTGRHRRTY